MPRSVLLVESDNDLAETIGAMLRALDYPVTVLEDETRAVSAMHGIRFGLLITTLRHGADRTLAFAREAKLLLPQLKILVITGAGQGESRHDPAFDAILHKPFDMSALANIVLSLTSDAYPRTA